MMPCVILLIDLSFLLTLVARKRAASEQPWMEFHEALASNYE